MILNDQDARDLRDWYTSSLEEPKTDEFTRLAQEQAGKDLLDYEVRVQKEGRVPWQSNPKMDREAFTRIKNIRSGKKLDKDIPETVQRQSADLAYLAMRFQKPPEEVAGSLRTYQRAIMDLHPGKNYDLALQEDMDGMDYRLDAIEGAYTHAARSALAGRPEMNGFIEYSNSLEQEAPEGMTELYMSAYESTAIILEENKPQFERLAQSVESMVQSAGVNDTRTIMEVAGQLAAIHEDDRYMAIQYLETNVKAEKGPLIVFMNRVNEIARGGARLTPREIHNNALGIIRDIQAGRPLQEAIVIADRDSFESEYARAAYRVAYTAPGTRMLFYRELTPVEIAKRYEDAQKAGDFAETMTLIEQYVNQSIGPEPFFENPSFKAAWEQIVYGSARVGGDMAAMVVSAMAGRKMGGAVAGAGGGSNMPMVLGTAYAIRATNPSIQSSHYGMYRAEGLSHHDAYFLSETSAPIATTLQVMSGLFVLSKLPGLSSLSRRAGFVGRKPLTTGLVVAGESMGAEVAAEIADMMTAHLMQEFVSTIDSDIPGVDLGEKFKESLKSAPDIALNMLPYALIGGGRSAYISRNAQQNLFANEAALKYFGMDAEGIARVQQAETLSQKQEVFSEVFDVDRGIRMAIEAKERGVMLEDVIGDEVMAAIQMANENDGVVRAIKNEEGQIDHFEVQGEEGSVNVRTAEEISLLIPASEVDTALNIPFRPEFRAPLQRLEQDSGVDQQADVNYNDAVERGDMEAAQQMVDEAAKRAGYSMSHRQNDKAISPNGDVLLFADDPTSNLSYGEFNFSIRGLPPVPDYVIKFSEEYYGDADQVTPENIVESAQAWDDRQFVSDLWQAFENRFIDEGIVGFKTPDGGVVFDRFSALENNQIKSADPVARNDAGEVIPLSQRFGDQSQDIRFGVEQTAEQAALQKEVDPELKIAKAIESLDVTGQPEVTAAEAPAAEVTTQEAPLNPTKEFIKRITATGAIALEMDVPIAKIVINKDVRQFKEDADPDTGVVEGEKLSGPFDPVQAGRIVVWEKESGELEVVTGRHRLDLAKQNNLENIPAFVFREKDGFTQQDAVMLDAEFNIRDGQGKVKDYAHYFKTNPNITIAEAADRGLLSRDKGRQGWAIGREAVQGIYDLYANNRISQAKAVAIATGAPNLEAAQMIAVRKEKSMTADQLRFYTQTIAKYKGIESEGATQRGFEELLGEDSDFASIEAEASKIAVAQAQMLHDIKERIRAGANAARNPKAAKAMGIDVRDPDATRAQVAALREEAQNILDPDSQTMNLIRDKAGLPPLRVTEQAEAPVVVQDDPNQISMFDEPAAPETFVGAQKKKAAEAAKEIGEAWNDLQSPGIVPDMRRQTQSELRLIRALANYAVAQSLAAGATVAQSIHQAIQQFGIKMTPNMHRSVHRAFQLAQGAVKRIEKAEAANRESVINNELSKIAEKTDWSDPARTTIREQTGQISPTIRITAREVLRRLYTAQSRAAVEAARFTKKELADIKRQLAEEVIGALPLDQRGKYIKAVANVENQAQLKSQLDRLEKDLARMDHRDAVRELRKTIKKLPARMRPEYKVKVDAIVDAIDTRKMTAKTKKQLNDMAEFLQNNPENQIPFEVLEKLKRMDLANVDDMSSQDIRQLDAMLKSYIGLNELKNKLLTDRRKRQLSEVKKEIIGEISEIAELTDQGEALQRIGSLFGKDLSHLEKTDRTMVQKYFGEMATRPENLFAELSENLRELIFENIEIDGYQREMRTRHREEDKLFRAMEAVGKPFGVKATRAQNKSFTRWVNEIIAFRIDGKNIKPRRNELVYLYELTLDPDRLRRVLKHGFVLKRRGRKTVYLPTVEDLDALPKAIGQEGIALAEAHRETYNGELRTELNKEWVDVHFYEVAPNQDYTPSRTDPTRTVMSLEDMQTERRVMTQEGRGMFQERNEAAVAPLEVSDSMEVWSQHLDGTAKTVAYLKAGRDVRTILNDNEVKRAIINRYGDDFWSFIVNKIADQTIGVQGVRTGYFFDNVLRRFIQNAGISILSLRMTTPLINPSGIPIAASYMHNPANMGKAMSVFSNPSEWRRIAPLMRKHSPYYRERYDNFTQQVTSGVFGERSPTYGVKPLAAYGLVGIEATDKLGAWVRWRGAELDIAQSRKDLEVGSDAYYAEVSREWQKMMFRSENSAHGLGMTGFITAGKRNPWAAPWMMFTSSVSKIYSNARRAVVLARQGDYKQALGVSASVMASWIIATGMRRVLRNSLRQEDEEEERSFAGDLSREAIGQLPIIGGPLASALMSIETGRAAFRTGTVLDDSLSALSDIAVNAYKAVESAMSDAATREGDAKWKEDAEKAVNGVLEMAAMVTGAPYSALGDWGKLLTKLTGEEQDGSEFLTQMLEDRGMARDPDQDKFRREQLNRIYRAIVEEDPSRFQDAVEQLSMSGERVTRQMVQTSVRGRYNRAFEVRRKISLRDMSDAQRERFETEMKSYREDIETMNELWGTVPRSSLTPPQK